MYPKNCIITFPSIHYALKAEARLKKSGISVKLIPVPRNLSSDCGIALEFSAAEEKKVKEIVLDEDIKIEQIRCNSDKT